MKNRSVAPMRIAKYGYVAFSVLSCIAGILMIVLPTPSVDAIGIFAGTAMIIFGTIKMVGYFSKDLFRLAFQYDLEFGILIAILGIITLFRPGNVMLFLCFTLGILFIAESMFKFRISFQAKLFGIRTWWLTNIFSVITGLAGINLIVWPSEAVPTLVVLLGIALLAEGIQNLTVALSLVKIIKTQKPDYIDVEI